MNLNTGLVSVLLYHIHRDIIILGQDMNKIFTK